MIVFYFCFGGCISRVLAFLAKDHAWPKFTVDISYPSTIPDEVLNNLERKFSENWKGRLRRATGLANQIIIYLFWPIFVVVFIYRPFIRLDMKETPLLRNRLTKDPSFSVFYPGGIVYPKDGSSPVTVRATSVEVKNRNLRRDLLMQFALLFAAIMMIYLGFAVDNLLTLVM